MIIELRKLKKPSVISTVWYCSSCLNEYNQIKNISVDGCYNDGYSTTVHLYIK